MTRLPLPLLLTLCVLAAGCSSNIQPPTAPQILEAREKAELVSILGTQALDAFDREISRLVTGGVLRGPKAETLAASSSEVRDVLKRLHEGLEVTREEATKALDKASAMVGLARAAGANLPPVTDQALMLARELVGE
ncbi:MAG TPA: hypothetical protein VGK73_30305 [Polyangiaceae bacterium]